MEVKGQQWSQCFSAFSLDIAQCCCKLQFTPTGCCDSRIVGLSLCPNDLTYKMEIIDFSHFYHCCCCLVTKLCQTLCDPMDCSLPSSSVHGDFSGKNTRVGCHALLQGIFLTQGLNSHLPHCRWILCHLSLVASPQVPVSTIKFTCFLASVLSTLYLIKQYILSC